MPEREQFGLLETEMNGRRLIANIDLSLRMFTDKRGFPWLLSLSRALQEADEDGLPTREEADALNAWEEQAELAISSAVNSKYVGRVTWNGHRELLYHLKEPEAATSALQRLIDGRTTRPFAFRCQRDESWSRSRTTWRRESGSRPHKWSHTWRMAVGEVHGQMGVVALRQDNGGWSPHSIIRVNVAGHLIGRVVDYSLCRWVLARPLCCRRTLIASAVLPRSPQTLGTFCRATAFMQ